MSLAFSSMDVKRRGRPPGARTTIRYAAEAAGIDADVGKKTAQRHAFKIRAYWATRSERQPVVEVVPKCKTREGDTVWGVQSDMVGGMPR